MPIPITPERQAKFNADRATRERQAERVEALRRQSEQANAITRQLIAKSQALLDSIAVNRTMGS